MPQRCLSFSRGWFVPKFQIGSGDWTRYRSLPGEEIVLRELEEGFNDPNTKHVLYMHGKSTSRNGKQTSRSVVREIMRGKAATPYIDRRCCIQHDSVFVAALKQRKR